MEATTEQQKAEGREIVRVLAAVLDRLVTANAPLAVADPGQVTKFHAMKAPGIAIEQYLERIHKYASCSNECFTLALIYIDRLIQRSNFLLTELNVHRVVITAILLAAKFFDDAYYNNAYYAKVGGVLVSEMNGLEVDFLFRINFSLHVPPEVFDKYQAELLIHSGTANSNACEWPNSTPENHSPVSVAQPPPHHHQQQVCAGPPLPTPTSHANAASVVAAAQMMMSTSASFASTTCAHPPLPGIVHYPKPGHVPSSENGTTSFIPLQHTYSLPIMMMVDPPMSGVSSAAAPAAPSTLPYHHHAYNAVSNPMVPAQMVGLGRQQL